MHLFNLSFFYLFVLLIPTLVYAKSDHTMHKDHHHKNMPNSNKKHNQKFDNGMKSILKEYIKIHKALVSRDIKNISQAAKKIANLSKSLDSKSVKGEHADHYKNIPTDLSKYSQALVNSKNIKEARQTFKKLSQPFAMWVGMAKPAGYQVMYCPMVKASWVQVEGKTQNPYDEKMPSCGSKV